MFLKHITYCQRKAFYEGEYEKLNELILLNAIMLPISTKSEIMSLNEVQETLQDLEFLPKQQWDSYYIVQLANS